MKTKTYWRDYMRERRAEARVEGFCQGCAGARPVRPGLKTCEECSQRGTQSKATSRTRQKMRTLLGLDQ
jgi:hypothetical protein